MSDIDNCRKLIEKKSSFLKGTSSICDVIESGNQETSDLHPLIARLFSVLCARYTDATYWSAGSSVFEIYKQSCETKLTPEQIKDLNSWIDRSTIECSCNLVKTTPKSQATTNSFTGDSAPVTSAMTPAPMQTIEEILRQLFGSNIPAEFLNTSSVKPASRDALFDLRIHTITSREESEGASCAVCLDEFECGKKVKKMPCKHFFHDSCLMTWLGKQNTCPACRHELPSEKQTWDWEEYKIRREGAPTHGMYS
eukprot:GDKJ01014462.1.p1 GENE.GDKJ01014462.1~~GDKJ01014462.1.p1  ORF type:complete len:253 (+),score=20.81 GDKJ01014462.1:28-786(+)